MNCEVFGANRASIKTRETNASDYARQAETPFLFDRHMPGQPLTIESIHVRADRIEVDMRLLDARFCRSDDALIAACLEYAPSLPQHACRNSQGISFASVMYTTSLPHVFEHLVIDAQTRAARDEERVFTATTQWDVHDAMLAHVAFSYEDDLLALSVVRCTIDFLNSVLLAQRS